MQLAELEAIADRFPRSWAVAGGRALPGPARRGGGTRRRLRGIRGCPDAARAAGERFERARTLLIYGDRAPAGEAQAGGEGSARPSAEPVSRGSARRSGPSAPGRELHRISGAAPALARRSPRPSSGSPSSPPPGRSNKQIAAELHITVRTVESNLTRIYRKLGVTSRGQLTQLVRQ